MSKVFNKIAVALLWCFYACSIACFVAVEIKFMEYARDIWQSVEIQSIFDIAEPLFTTCSLATMNLVFLVCLTAIMALLRLAVGEFME